VARATNSDTGGPGGRLTARPPFPYDSIGFLPTFYYINFPALNLRAIWWKFDIHQRPTSWLTWSYHPCRWGVNLNLAMTGQEEIQWKVFTKLGLKDAEIRSWCDYTVLGFALRGS
jgi:hypothetical protein